MSVLAELFPISAAPPAPSLSHVPLLREVPALLEYRADVDPDAEFIPKTVAGFALGALAMGVALDLGETLWIHADQPFEQLLPGLILRFAFMVGIMGVSASLLLVGLKVRADHSSIPLYAKHWLNSIGTGSAYAFMMYAPWVFINHSIVINRFLAAAILMAIMSFPAIAAKWTIGPHAEQTAAV